jgi:hypothetical protein
MTEQDWKKLSSEEQYTAEQQLRNFVAALLSSIPSESVRDRVARGAQYDAGDISNESKGKGLDLWRVIPADLDLDWVTRTVNGFLSYAASVCGADDSATLPDILEAAKTYAMGVPIGGDPTGSTRDPELAAVILDAAVRSEEPIDPDVARALVAITDEYDCAVHTYPLGGGALWDKIKQGWKSIFGTPEEKAEIKAARADQASAKAEAARADYAAQTLKTLVNAGLSVDEAKAIINKSAAQQLVESPAAAVGGVEQQDLDNLKKALSASSEQLAESKRESEEAALRIAKMLWATKILEAPDEVVKFMQDVKPDWSTTSGALQTALDTLSAAKESGDLGTLKSLSRLMRSLDQSAPSVAARITALLGGDADALAAALDDVSDPGNYAESLREYLLLKSKVEGIENVPWQKGGVEL